jgi:hypothetical protein
VQEYRYGGAGKLYLGKAWVIGWAVFAVLALSLIKYMLE